RGGQTGLAHDRRRVVEDRVDPGELLERGKRHRDHERGKGRSVEQLSQTTGPVVTALPAVPVGPANTFDDPVRTPWLGDLVDDLACLLRLTVLDQPRRRFRQPQGGEEEKRRRKGGNPEH